VIKDCAGRYCLSFVVEVDPISMPAQEPSVLNPEASRPASEQPILLGFSDSGACELKGSKVGIDLGIKTFATLSTGDKIQAPNYSRLDRLIRKRQKALARRQKGSDRRARMRLVIAKLHAQLADKRLDFLHKLSTKLAKLYQLIVLENLNVSSLLKNWIYRCGK